MIDTLITALQHDDCFAIIARIEADESPEQVMGIYNELVKRLYDHKNLAAMSIISVAAIHYGLTHGLPGIAKTIAYNLSANLWAGWGYDGITITASDHRLGLDMARLNLRLAIELEKPDLPRSRAHWLLGAQLLANGDRAGAKAQFELATDFARKADENGDILLNEAYSALLSGDGTLYTEALTKLNDDTVEYGNFLRDQVETVKDVFQL